MMNPNYIQNPAGARPAVIRTGHQSAIKIVLGVFAAMVALLLGLIVLLLIGAETGLVEMLIGLVCATLPVPIYVTLLLWIDRYESEPLWMLATAFFWGALAAVLIALIFNTGIEIITNIATGSGNIAKTVGAVISAPIVEESAKGFILLVLFFWKSEFDGIVDGIVYAGMVGLGFAMSENILYYGRAATAQGRVNLQVCKVLVLSAEASRLTVFVVLRGMAEPVSHPLFNVMSGIVFVW